MVSWYWARKPGLYLYPSVGQYNRTQSRVTPFAFTPCFTSRLLARFTRASSCPTRAWKRAWRWKSSGSRATPRRNIAPSGPPRPTPSTQCGTRSPSFSRRFAPIRVIRLEVPSAHIYPAAGSQCRPLWRVFCSLCVMLDRSCCPKWQLSGSWFTKRMASSWDTGSSQSMPSSQVGEAERTNTVIHWRST